MHNCSLLERCDCVWHYLAQSTHFKYMHGYYTMSGKMHTKSLVTVKCLWYDSLLHQLVSINYPQMKACQGDRVLVQYPHNMHQWKVFIYTISQCLPHLGSAHYCLHQWTWTLRACAHHCWSMNWVCTAGPNYITTLPFHSCKITQWKWIHKPKVIHIQRKQSEYEMPM